MQITSSKTPHRDGSSPSVEEEANDGEAPQRPAYVKAIFVSAGALAGILIACLVLPPAILTAVTAGLLGPQVERFSLTLASVPLPTRSQVVTSDGKLVATFFTENRVPVPITKIAPVMRQAIIAVEDRRFYHHGALDVRGTLRALVHNVRGRPGVQGGSSITQQYVKMALVEQCGADRRCIEDARAATLARKIRELRYGVAIEHQLSKDQILERYLNIAYFGDGAYGVEVAAEHYFSTTAGQLSLSQAAMLAGLARAPGVTEPVGHPDAALSRRNAVLAKMVEQHMVTAQQAARAAAVGFSRGGLTVSGSGCLDSPYPFICDYVRRTLLQQPSFGTTRADRAKMLDQGGLTIRTTIDSRSQQLVQARLADVVGPTDPLISTMDMIEPGTGRIVAMAQSRPVMGSDEALGQTYWNFGADPSLGGTQGYQAGSTFKAFTAAAALERGIPLTTQLNAPHTMNYRGRSFDTCSGREKIRQDWKVTNSTRADGLMDMYRAAAYSVNNYFVPLELETGMCAVTQLAQRLGVTAGNQGRSLAEEYQHVPAFTLGSVEISPLSRAEAYATFAARGIHCKPVIIDSISTSSGNRVTPPAAGCRRVMAPSVADGVNTLLAYVITEGTGHRAMISDRRPQAGKTGTISSNKAAWFAGYTPQVVGVAMISIDNQQAPFNQPGGGNRGSGSTGLKGYSVPSTRLRLTGTGSDVGQKLWKPIMESYLQGVPKTPFVDPPLDVIGGPPSNLLAR